jgi:hypothetical protein
MKSRFAAVATVLAICLCIPAFGADPPARSDGAKPKEAELPPFTAERESAALEFIRRHHSELEAVLAGLKNLKREEYEQAIRELWQTREKLSVIKTSDETLHDLMLEVWRLDSQAKLLAARLVFEARQGPLLVGELKSLLYKQVDLQRRIVEHNRDRVLASLEEMNANIKLLTEKREEFVERRLQNLTRTSAKRGAQPSPKPTASAGAVPAAPQSSDK